MKRAILAFAVALSIFCRGALAGATDEFAACTDRPCGYCHEDPAGGGALSAAGLSLQAIVGTTPGPAPSALRRAFTIVLLFIHIFAAFMWFGTILYVHLILKPAYAAGGLPRGELRLGWAGILAVGLTGIVLTLQRIPSWHALFQTRFGVLLSIKIALFLLMLTTAILVTRVIGPRLGKRRVLKKHPGRGAFLPQDLAHFNGKEGRSAFIAYRGKVYDVSASQFWKDGVHMRRHGAGADLTTAIGQAPHGEEKILALSEKGTLLPAAKSGRSPHERAFYFMAYLNLGIVCGVLLVIALWHT